MVGIIGSGISGISMSRLLFERGLSSVVFEKSKKKGGLISCDFPDGVTYHKVGGHVFNSKNKEVIKWFFSHFNQNEEFVSAQRNSKIFLDQKIIGYPIESHLYELDERTLKSIVIEWLRNEKIDKSNFYSFLKSSFGKTLFELYFEPYNKKIWQTDLNNISLDWLEGKLPMLDKSDMLSNSILRSEDTTMAHSTFYYPKKGGSQFIIDRLSSGLNVKTSKEVENIKKVKGKWKVEDQLFDSIVYTGDVTKIPALFPELDFSGIDFSSFRSHGTTTVLCEVDPNDFSWIYLPDPNVRAHRIINTGNFSDSNNGRYLSTATLEFSEKLSKKDITTEINKIPFTKKMIEFHHTKKTYVIQSTNTRATIKKIKKVLEVENVYLLGRFAEWEYYNMDNAIESAMQLSKRL